MSPDPVLVDRLNQHGQGHLLRWWGELNEGRASAARRRRFGSIDFDQLDRLIAELVRGESDDGPAAKTGSSRSTSSGCRRPTASALRGAGRPNWGPTRWRRARSASFWSPAARARGWAIEGPKGTFPIGPVSSASLFQIHAEKIVAPGPTAWTDDPALRHDQPREPRGDDRVLRAATAGSASSTCGSSRRGRCRPSIARPARSCWRRKDRVALSPDGHGGTLAALAAPGPDGMPELPRRDARSRACGRSFTFRSTIRWSGSPSRRSSACTAKRTPRSRSRSSSGSHPTRSWAWSSPSTAGPR